MKRHLLTLCVFMLCFYTYAQNNVYGKKVVGLDSLVSDTIRARTQGKVSISNELSVDGNVTINSDTIYFPTGAGRFGATSGGLFFITSDGISLSYNTAQNAWDFQGNSIDDVSDGNFNILLTDSLNVNNSNATISSTGNATFSGDVTQTTSSGTISHTIATDDSDDFARIILDANRTADNVAGQIRFDNNGNSIAIINAYRDNADDEGRLAFFTQPASGSAIERLSISGDGDATFSKDVTAQTLNVLGGNQISAIIGSDFDDDDALTNSTNKLGRFGVPHYTNAEQPIAQIYGRSDATSNQVNIGGGTGQMNAATEINFYTAANTTTTTGTERLTINSSGKATFAGDMTFSDYGSGSNTGTAAYSLAVDASGNVIEEGLGITTNEQSTTTSATSYTPTFTINLQRLYICSISIYQSGTEYFSNFYMVYGRPSSGVTSTSMHGKQGAGTNGSVTPTFGVSGTTLTVTLSSMTSASKEIVVRITEL